MTSPALRRTTVSPMRTPLALTTSWLCRVANSTSEPATVHRLDHRVGGDPAGASDADPDVDQLGVDLLGRVLPRDGPARSAGGGAEPALEPDLVELDHDAVDLVLDRVAVLAVVGDELPHALQPVHDLRVGGGGQAPLAQQVVGVRETAEVLLLEALQGADAVHDHVQRPGGGDAGVLLAQRAGRRVARVGEGLLARLHQARVELLEALHGEEDLAAHLDQLGEALAGEALGDVGDRTDVGGDVLAGAAVAAGGGAGESAVLIGEVDREAVHLQLAQEVVGHALQLTGDAVGPLPQLLVVEGVVQREHALAVRDLGELRLVVPRDLLGR